ncbi:hypothetical protein [uncultured Kordia sp.]|uniref:hypothetical protein n=1 Tax=uncultured Kordia sp. TaxID=507699 RepID=UPI0026136A98|nr:hypothetical protein [uncultured Kordia sp.]
MTIFKSKIDSTKKSAEFEKVLVHKTLKTGKTLSIMNTVNMTENDKDFYGKYENEVLSITRIRRLSVLRFLPKLIIEFPELEKNKKFNVKLGLFTFLLSIILCLALLANVYELLSTSRLTNDLITVLGFIGIFFVLIYIEFFIYKQKLNNY